MNTQYVQALRYKLQKRVRRLNTIGDDLFGQQLKLFFLYLDSEPILTSLLEELDARRPQAKDEVEKALAAHQAWIGESEEEHAAVAHHMLRGLAAATDHTNALFQTGFGLGGGRTLSNAIEAVRRVYVEGLYEYLDEHLDDQRLMLELLRRYKHRCEWFHRERLHALWSGDTARGEKQLGLDLYAYLYEQGVDYHIEPWGESGEIDLIGMQHTDDPLLCDVKIFNPEKSKGATYIRNGVQQVHTYMGTYNESVGYLVIFNTSPRPLVFETSGGGGVPWITIGAKAMFLVAIDLYPHEATASKRGALDPIVITEAALTGMTDTSAEAELPVGTPE